MSIDFKEFHGRTVMLAAGGTGGHLFPAQALAEELVRRGFIIHLMTDERVKDYGKSFPAIKIHEVPSASLSPSKPWRLPSQALRLWKGYRVARAILSSVKPIAVCGFGGYPSFPPLLAASRLDIPSCVHDQNAVMGRANRALAKMATVVASSFPTLASLPESAKGKLTVTGNPVRDLVLKSKAAPYAAPAANETFELLVFGGSQGAQFFSQFMPGAIKALPQAVLKSLKITQQCRPEDIDAARAGYSALGVAADLAPFFMDMPQRIARSHLVICRSGASTIAELGVIGRPAIMVPLPHAIDNDQLKNAESFSRAGAGWLMPQADLTAENLAAFFTRLRYQQAELNQAAAAALKHGRPDAAARLADLVVKIAGEGQKRTT